MRLSLNKRFIAYLLALGMLPLLCVGAVSIWLTRSAIEDATRHHVVREVEQMVVLFDSQSAQIEELISNISGVEEINAALAKSDSGLDTFTRLATQARIGYVLNHYLNLKGLISINIFTLNGSHYHVGDTLDVGNLNTDLRDQLIQETMAQPDGVYWAGVRPNINGNSANRMTLVAAHMIARSNPMTSKREPVALLQVNFDLNQVRHQFAGTKGSGDNTMLMLDGHNRFIYHPDASMTGKPVGAEMLDILAQAQDSEQSSFTGNGVLVTRAKLRAPGWRVVSLVPQASLTRAARGIGLATALVMLASLVLVGLGTFSLVRRVVDPLRAISDRFRLLREAPQVLQTPLPVTGTDEIAELTTWLNAFLDNLSARRQAEKRLQLAASVFEHSREGILVTNPSGTIIDVNEAFTRITGYPSDEAVGQNPRFLKSDRQDNTFYETMWRNLTEQGFWSGETWNRRKDGSVYAEMLTISAVRDAQGVVQQYVGLFSDITAVKEHQSQLEHIAHFDALTNLPNRVLLADRLQQAMTQAQRRKQQVAVVYLDLDGFKSINDQHGHDAGDHVLITLAQRMKQALRDGDSLARLGGDEFVAVLIDLENVNASIPILNRLLLACTQPVPMGDLELHVSASLGVTTYPQEQDIDADQLLRQADQTMYQAKVAGKNRFHIFDAALDSTIRSHHESLERIRLAFEQNEFVLRYQPRVNMRTGQIVGAEALIRWQHPEKGLLAPALFFPVFEDHALAVTVGEWVIDSALDQIAQWQTVGLDCRVSVNVGARQLQQSDFVDRLKFLLAQHPQVNPAQLELEVLETSALKDITQVSEVIEACSQLGVTFALDDFGTGYSSLTYLKRLHVAALKIDQSFVRDMLDDPDDLSILEGIIGLAASFKRQVIAEGVETVTHGSLLLQLGCELAQGYGIARPMPAEQMPQWAAQWHPDAAWQRSTAD